MPPRWICPRCATHVQEDRPACPCCGALAPARHNPELARNVQPELEQPAIPDCSANPTFIQRPGVPSLESQWPKRASEVGCLIGFATPIVVGGVAVLFDILIREWDRRALLFLIAPFPCALFSAVFCACAAILLEAVVKTAAGLLGYGPAPEALSRYDDLAKADSLADRPSGGGEQDTYGFAPTTEVPPGLHSGIRASDPGVTPAEARTRVAEGPPSDRPPSP